jgi:hypothetical protein
MSNTKYMEDFLLPKYEKLYDEKIYTYITQINDIFYNTDTSKWTVLVKVLIKYKNNINLTEDIYINLTNDGIELTYPLTMNMDFKTKIYDNEKEEEMKIERILNTEYKPIKITEEVRNQNTGKYFPGSMRINTGSYRTDAEDKKYRKKTEERKLP